MILRLGAGSSADRLVLVDWGLGLVVCGIKIRE
jgi:hypothetical protein